MPFGALAQMGERLICIQEVRSSILLGSTIYRLVLVRASCLDKNMKICAITMVYRDYWALSQWYAHYSRHLGGTNLFVVAHGADPMVQTICPEASVITIPRDTFRGFDRVRGRMLNSIQNGLGEVFDWVIRTDADELICLDPAEYASFQQLFEKQSASALFALGLNVAEAGEDRLADGEMALASRSTAVFTGHYSKAWAVRDRIALVRHGVQIRPKFVQDFEFCMPSGVYLAHLKYASIAALTEANKHRTEVAGGSERGLPGTAWKDADKHASKFFERMADIPGVAWEQAKSHAIAELGNTPVRDIENGLVSTRSIHFLDRTTLPDWFKNC